MEIENLIDLKNEKLYHRVSNHYKVVLKENKDWRAEVWTSYIRGHDAIIAHCPTSFPQAAFTHELLHIDTQIRGYKRIVAGVSINRKVQEHMQTIIKCLDDNFQHHKMAKRFLALGYPPEQFIDDDGSSTIHFLKSQLKEEGRSAITLVFMYMSLIEPFMGITDKEKSSLKIEFGDYEGGRFKQIFDNIDEIMSEWVSDESFDAENYMIRFLKNTGVTDTWFSYKQDLPGMYRNDFPACGFFVDNSFSADEIAKIYGR